MEKHIIELSEIRGKLLHAIDTKDELYAMMQVNDIDNLLYAMNEENKALQASIEQSKLDLADISKSVCTCDEDECSPIKFICTKCNKEWKPQ